MLRHIPKIDYKKIEQLQEEMYIPKNDKFSIFKMTKCQGVCKICNTFQFGYYEYLEDKEGNKFLDGICTVCHLKYLNKQFDRCYICFNKDKKAYPVLSYGEGSFFMWPTKFYCKKCVEKAVHFVAFNDNTDRSATNAPYIAGYWYKSYKGITE